MNLLELIIKSDIEWPALARIAVQDDGGALKWSTSSDTPVLYKSSGVWDRIGGGSDPEYGIIEMADDWSTRIITREEWQQERYKMRNQQDNSWHERGELPSVGVPVELWFGGAYAYDCEFIGKRGSAYILWNLDADRPDAGEDIMCEFRPLRTEREKAIDEMATLIGVECQPSPINIGSKRAAEILYNAGYRKEQSK